MKVQNKSDLFDILEALIKQWSAKEVEAALEALTKKIDQDTNRQAHDLTDARQKSSHAKRTRKLLATEQVTRAKLSGARAEILHELALRYDDKKFLPTTADVRELLLMIGETPGALKDRSSAFRQLLKVMTELPQNQLENIARSRRYSGPSTLEPLSDAISTASSSLNRRY